MLDLLYLLLIFYFKDLRLDLTQVSNQLETINFLKNEKHFCNYTYLITRFTQL